MERTREKEREREREREGRERERKRVGSQSGRTHSRVAKVSRVWSVDIQGYASSRRPADVRAKRILVSDALFDRRCERLASPEETEGFRINLVRLHVNPQMNLR